MKGGGEGRRTPVKTIARHHVSGPPELVLSSAPAMGFPMRLEAATTVYASPILTLVSPARQRSPLPMKGGRDAPELVHIPTELHEQARYQRNIYARSARAN